MLKSRGQVLVVDDSADTRAALSGYLRRVGYEARSAENGQQALHMLRDGLAPAVIVCDAAVPSMGGRDFIEQMRSGPNAARVLLMTAARGDGSEGADAAIAKPFQLVDFGDKLLRLLREHPVR
jgi:two-component system, OmpR family, response regulator